MQGSAWRYTKYDPIGATPSPYPFHTSLLHDVGEELEKLFEITHRHNVIVVSDEVHSELIMPGYKFLPSLALKEYENDKMFLIDTIKHEQDLYEKMCEELLKFEIE